MNTVKTIDIQKIREDFPTLSVQVHGKPLVYLDNAATAHKPKAVIEALDTYYREQNSNVHRGVHYLSAEATTLYEQAREKNRAFINAEHAHEVIFTRGTTESINMVAQSFGEKFINEGDEIILTMMEHHSNIVPWQIIAEKKGATIKVVPVNEAGELDLEEYANAFSEKTKIAAFVHISNTLGTINPVKEMIATAHSHNVPVLIDGAQAVPHMKVDVQDLDADFYVYSGHKLFGPTGIGILYGKEKWLNEMPPYQGGGSMIKKVSFAGTTWNELPEKFEAGTPHIAGAIGLGAAIDYVESIGFAEISAYEKELADYLSQQLKDVEDMKIYGTANNKTTVISFNVEGVHPSDLATLLDVEGVAVRVGHHCTQPLMEYFGTTATIRASFAFYNTIEEADQFISALKKAIAMFK